MIMLRSWIYTILFLAWSLFAPIIQLPCLVTRRGALGGIRMWARGVMFLARTIVGVSFRAEGKENIPKGGCIIAAQHQSSFETYKLFLEVENPVFVFKRELVFIPFIGWYILRAGLVPIDRGAGAKAMRRMLRAADAAVARGAQILIFPEGTRTAPGDHAPYRPGVVGLYNHCNVPLIPMALNSGYTWGKTRVRKDPGEIVFKYLPAIEAGLGKQELLTKLRESLEGAAATLPKPMNLRQP
jgi:1-acyl-sn-glycerol-3-phosphate acyltransferase